MTRATSKFILLPTSVAQWYALINEAQMTRAIHLEEELESYLVFLLMRYTNKPEVASSVFSIEMFDSINAVGQLRKDKLRDIGDKCLLYSGLFPGRAEKKRVKASFFIHMGQLAYGTLSNAIADTKATLFASLCEEFIALMDVLQAMRKVAYDDTHHTLTQIEIWHDLNEERLNYIMNQEASNHAVPSSIKRRKEH